jgi:hypothetical protein
MPFPPNSKTKELGELHDELALVDTWVANAIIPFVEDGVYRPIKVDPLAELEKIRDRATELGRSFPPGDRERLDPYIRYADALREVYERFLSVPKPT